MLDRAAVERRLPSSPPTHPVCLPATLTPSHGVCSSEAWLRLPRHSRFSVSPTTSPLPCAVCFIMDAWWLSMRYFLCVSESRECSCRFRAEWRAGKFLYAGRTAVRWRSTCPRTGRSLWPTCCSLSRFLLAPASERPTGAVFQTSSSAGDLQRPHVHACYRARAGAHGRPGKHAATSVRGLPAGA